MELKPLLKRGNTLLQLDNDLPMMDVGEVERLIDALADNRSQMLPAVPAQPETIKPQYTIRDPSFIIVEMPETPFLGVALRHPGLGWISVALTAAAVKELISILTDALPQPLH